MNTKKILIYVIALDKIYTSQVLEVVTNRKNSIFLLILLNLGPNKSPFNQYYPKSVPNPDILIILLPENDKIVVLPKILFLTIFPIAFDKIYTSQVLEVITNHKNSIFLLSLLNLRPNKSPFNQ